MAYPLSNETEFKILSANLYEDILYESTADPLDSFLFNKISVDNKYILK